MIQILSYGFGTLKDSLSKLTSHFSQCIHYGHTLNRQLETIPWSKIQDPGIKYKHQTISAINKFSLDGYGNITLKWH